MAIVFVANRGNIGQASVNGTNSFAIATPASITPGNTLFFILGVQNNTSGSPGLGSVPVVVDPRGNSWVFEAVNSSFVNAGTVGQTLLVFRSLNVVQYQVGDNLTMAGTIAGLQMNWQIHEFSGVSQGPRALRTTNNFGVSATTSTNLPITVDAAGQLVLAASAEGNNSAITGDSDTTDGAWSAAFRKASGQWQIFEEHKILTGFTTPTQNFQTAWTASGGDNTWQQILLVFDASFPGGSPGQQFPPQDNPNYGCPDAGFEQLPTGSASVPVDTGTAYQIEHSLPTYSFGTRGYAAVTTYDDTATEVQQHHIAYDLYQKGAEVPQDSIVQLTFPLGAAFPSSATAPDAVDYFNPAGTNLGNPNNAQALAALSAAGGNYVQLNSNVTTGSDPNKQGLAYVDLQFNFSTGTYNLTDYANSRVIRIGIRYKAWKDDSSTQNIPVGEGLQVAYNLNQGSNSYYTEIGTWLVPDYQRNAVQQLSWFGETNPMPLIPNYNSNYGGAGSQLIWYKTPPDAGTSWSYTDLLNLASGGSNFIRVLGMPGADFSQTAVYLDFIELVVELAPERRMGNAIHNVATTGQYAASPIGAAPYLPSNGSIISVWPTINQNGYVTVSGSPNDYVLVAREALPASTSDYYSAYATALGALANASAGNMGIPPGTRQFFGPSEATGPSLNFLGYTRARPTSPDQRPLTKRVVVDGVFGDSGTYLKQYQLSFGALDRANYLSAGSFFPVFTRQSPLAELSVYNGHNLTQRFYANNGGGNYSFIKVVCQPDPLTTASLVMTVSGSTATLTPAAWASGTDLGNGWRECYVALSPFLHVAVDTIETLTFSSTTTSSAPWKVSGVRALGPSITLVFEPFAQNSGAAVDSYAAVLGCAMNTPGVTFGSATVSLDPSDKAICRATSYTVPTLTLTNASLFDRIIIDRTLDGTNYTVCFRSLTKLSNNYLFVDEECPWDVGGAIPVGYRVHAFRDSDRQSTFQPPSGTDALIWGLGPTGNPGAAFGLSSNEAGFSVAYVPVDTTDVQVTWNPLNPVQTVPLHGQDYQYALRTPENRGLSVTVTVLVDQIIYCCMPIQSV